MKKRKDFATERLYAEFVYEAVQKGSMVRVRSSTGFNAFLSNELKEGDVGIVCSKEHGFSSLRLLTVKFGKLRVRVKLPSRSVEVVA